jgi:signal transduction histidine kinase
MLVAGTLALLAAFCGGYMITGQAMRPLEQIIDDAERISAENFNDLVTVQNPHDELGRLAITLNRTFSRLRRSLQQMSRFTADAAHELRTPLAALRLECDVALKGEPDLNSLKQSMSLALEEIDRLSHIVNQLLSLSRLDSGVDSQNMDSVFLQPLIRDVAELLDKSARVKGIDLMVGQIPDCVIQGDDVELSRLFFNLIDNAIKYTSAGGRVSIIGRQIDNSVELSITDTGIGIEQKDMEHLFDRFYRVDTSRNAMTGGAGLGLAICKAVADAHQAKLSVTSAVGCGSTFKVTFPVVDVIDVNETSDECIDVLQNVTTA